MVIGVSLGVFCVYYVFLIGGEEFADRNIISPFWAMWTTNALFAAVGVGILHGVTRGPLWRRSGPGGYSDGSSTSGLGAESADPITSPEELGRSVR